jgi:ribosomal protein S18 acetylase RimI-like enzyme
MINYSEDKIQQAKDVAQVFKSSGLRRPSDDLERVQRMIDHADILITAWDGDAMIGVARAITDFSYCCYLSDLAVDAGYQHRGIGTELVRRVQAIIGDECSLLLLSAPEAFEYYLRIGFETTDKAFLIRRKQ